VPELEGMKAICNHVKRSESTVLDWIRFMGFPAKKLGGVWVSETSLISDWKKKIITSDKTKERIPLHILKASNKAASKNSQADKNNARNKS